MQWAVMVVQFNLPYSETERSSHGDYGRIVHVLEYFQSHESLLSMSPLLILAVYGDGRCFIIYIFPDSYLRICISLT